MRLIKFILFLFFLFFYNCVPEKTINHDPLSFDVEDPSFLKIMSFQEKQDSDSLLAYLGSDISAHRYKSAMAFASHQDPKAIDSLAQLLSDPVLEVSAAAAYALGQIGNQSSQNDLVSAFKQKDSASVNTTSNKHILEALGKLSDKEMLNFIATTTSYKETDDQLLLGQARAIYRFGYRNITTPKGTERMIALVLNKKVADKVRLVAAHYLMRYKDVDISKSKFQLLNQLRDEKNVDIKMALATAVCKSNDIELVDPLVDIYREAKDYRVKSNLLKAFASFKNERFTEEALYALTDKNLHLATSAADYMIRNGSPDEAITYREYLNTNLHPQVKAKVYKAVLTHLPLYFTKTKQIVSNQIVNDINNTSNDYHKSRLIDALATDMNNYPYLDEIGDQNSSLIVKSAVTGGLTSIYNNKNLIESFKYPAKKRSFNRALAPIIEKHMRTGDIGVIAQLSTVLSDPKNGFKELASVDYSYLDTLKNKLTLPQDLEAYKAIIPAANYLLDTTFQEYKTTESKPTDWNLIKELSDSSYVKIVTDKGDITFRFFRNEAPGTVANFIELANSNFYDNKVFHRVVPNFVIQGGCTRGDGYGSPNYTIRSELPPLYYDAEGMVGMASAGLHTESAQFFITHSPAMHLDGKYTIFGKVISGMDIVHLIQEGDQIKDVQIIND